MNNDGLNKNLYIMDKENDKSSKINKIYPASTLDQIFDQMSPDKKTLRQIISDLRQEILTGGKGTIIFPVTSVNGKMGDVELSKEDIGLSNVDNTADKDKPLSQIQRDAIIEILDHFNFKMNLKELYDHLNDKNNPHNVTLESLNKNNQIEEMINRLITLHNNSINSSTHGDIRLKLSTLWNYVESLNKTLENRLANTLNTASLHYKDINAHKELFDKKENVINKQNDVDETNVNNHNLYPSIEALIKYYEEKEKDLIKNKLLPIKNWINDIFVVDTKNNLPTPKPELWNNVYFIRNSDSTNHEEIMICRKNGDEYYWSKLTLGSYSRFDDNYFNDITNKGLSLKMDNITQELMNSADMNKVVVENIKTLLTEAMKLYYKKNEIDNNFIKSINIIPGKELGTIQFYINDDKDTISDEIRITGLKRLAFLEWVTENELYDKAVHENHIMDNAVRSRHIEKNVDLKGQPTIEFTPGLNSDNREIANTQWVRLLLSQELSSVNLGDEALQNIKKLLNKKADKSDLDKKLDKSYMEFEDQGIKYIARVVYKDNKVFLEAEEA